MDISFNGVSASSLGLVSHGRPQILPQKNKSKISIPRRDGAFYFDDDTYSVRNVQCNFYLKSATNAAFETAVAVVAYWLTGSGYLILSDATKRFSATVLNEIEFSQRTSTAGIFSVVFECQPFAEDVTALSEAITGSAIDFGTKAKTYPQIVLTMTGAASYVQVSHVESGKYVRITDTLAGTEEIIIDCATGKVTIDDVLNVDKVSIDSLFFPLEYGTSTVTITTDGTATGNVVYRRNTSMLEQAHILDINENIVATIGTMPDACPIIELRQIKELVGGGYSDTCQLTVPANHADSIYIMEGNYILFQGLDGIWHEYRILKADKVYGATSEIVAYGEHAFYELLNDFIDDIRPTEATAATALTSALSGTRWTLGSADDLGNNSAYIYKTSVLAGLHQIAETWGGELYFRVIVSGGVIASRYVDILTRIGAETGKRFEFGKDLLSVKQTIDRSGLLTAIIGRGKGVEIESEDGTAYGRRLEFDEIEWTVAGGDDADKPLGQNWIGNATAAAAYGYGGRHIKGVVEFDDITDAEELLQASYDELQIRKVPQTTYEMSVITLEEVAGYDHEAVRIGDTVNVINNSVSPAITGSARIIKVDRNLTDSTDCGITLGNYIPTIANSFIEQAQKVSSFSGRSGVWDNSNAFEIVTGTGGIEYKLDLLRTQLASTVSGFSTDENGNMIFENATQTAALKLGAGILALANTKSGGEYVWRTFATGSGYTAEEMVAGTMRSDIIFTGELQAAFGSFLDLIAGNSSAQHMRLRLVEGDPVFEMYGNDGTTGTGMEMSKDRLRFMPNVTIRKYDIGTRKGLAFFVED